VRSTTARNDSKSYAHKFTHPLWNMQNVNNLNKIRGIMKIACYFLFSTDCICIGILRFLIFIHFLIKKILLNYI